MKRVLLLILISAALAAPTTQCRTVTSTHYADYNSWVLPESCGLGSLRSAAITNTGPNTVKAQGPDYSSIWIGPGGTVSWPNIFVIHGDTLCSFNARTEKGPWYATLQAEWELCLPVPNLVPRGNASMKPVHWNETVECATTYEDDDNDPDQSVKRLYVNEVEQDSNYTHFDNITCEYIPCDAWDCGQAVSVTVGVLNYAPIITNTSISELHFNETFWCNYSFYDADGDVGSAATKTFVNGIEKNITNYSHFDNITCEFMPFDGHVNGSVVNASTTVLNYAPSVLNISLPRNATRKEKVDFSYSFYDAENDDDKTVVRWFKNNVEVNGTQGRDVGHTFTLQLMPFDGHDYGKSRNASFTVYNQAPVISVSINKSNCTANTIDEDGDNMSISWTWFKNNESWDKESYSHDDIIVCQAIATDGYDIATANATWKVPAAAQPAPGPVPAPSKPKYSKTIAPAPPRGSGGGGGGSSGAKVSAKIKVKKKTIYLDSNEEKAEEDINAFSPESDVENTVLMRNASIVKRYYNYTLENTGVVTWIVDELNATGQNIKYLMKVPVEFNGVYISDRKFKVLGNRMLLFDLGKANGSATVRIGLQGERSAAEMQTVIEQMREPLVFSAMQKQEEIVLQGVMVENLPGPLPITAAVPARQDNIVLAGGVLVFSLLAGFKVKNRLKLGELGNTWKKKCGL